MSANVNESIQLSNVGTGAFLFTLRGGKYGLTAIATYGGGNQQMQQLAGDNVTWVNVGVAITAAGFSVYDLPPGQYRFNITTATANYLSLTNIPY